MSRFGLLLIALLSFSSLFSQIPSYVPTNGLVGWWPFNGNANDESGNGNNGTVNGATLTTDRFGNAGKAYSFDGIEDYISVPDNPILELGNSYSIGVWINFTSYPLNEFTAISKERQLDGTGLAIIIDNTAKVTHAFINGANYSIYSLNSLSFSQWKYVVITYDGVTSKLFFDGIPNNSSNFSQSLINSTMNWYFGKEFTTNGGGSSGYTNRYFYGKLDDIGIWNRALTPQEISNLYNTGPFDVSATTTTVCAGQPTTLSVQSITGTITTLNCASATNTGTLTAGTAASGVSSTIPYTGGNGGAHNGQTVTSTGVTGLTATLTAGTFASGNGSLTYTISGTPSASGTANFALNIGGQTCTLSLSVASNLSSQYPSGSVFCASGPTAIVDVTNPVTGKTWMDRNLGASQVATSSSDAFAYGDLYQWGRGSDGHQCRNSATTTTLSSTDQPGNGNFILAPNYPYNWRNPTNINLWQGVSGINNPCPLGYRLPRESELNAERLSWTSNNSLGAFSCPNKFTLPGCRVLYDGTIQPGGTNGFYWSSNINSDISFFLLINDNDALSSTTSIAHGNSVRCIKETVGSIGALNCGSSTLTGNLISGSAATGVSVSVPYTAGNGGFYVAQNISSTGVTGLTATISQGLFASGAGNLVYTISGTPSASGTASFALNIGGQTCTFNLSVASNLSSQYPSGSVFCASGPTAIVDVTNPVTGKTWMDRNLGANQKATSSSDINSYGDLYQWGRRSDGHQCRTSNTLATLSSIDQPAHGNFITISSGNYDWRSPQNDNLWQGVNAVNNPCPTGYRLPTETELEAERLSWSQNNSVGAFASPLKLPMAGNRNPGDGSLNVVGAVGYYWSSTVSGTYSRYLIFGGSSSMYDFNRALGFTVRCIKN